jgi:hypothetical protein
MWRKYLLVGAVALLAGCAWSEKSNWHLMDSGYSIDPLNPDEFVMEVHLNQLKELGGDINNARFHLFVAERLKWSGMCPSGWKFLPCIEDGSCVKRTSRSVTIQGRCADP